MMKDYNIKAYSVIRASHQSNTERGGVCLYYKEYLPRTRRIDICCNRNNCKQRKMFHDMPLQITNAKSRGFESFCKNFIDMLSGINKQQPTCSILFGDFNAKLSKWR